MEFRLYESATVTFKRGKLTKSGNVTLNNNTMINDLDQEQTYKHLGVNEGETFQHASMKENRKGITKKR